MTWSGTQQTVEIPRKTAWEIAPLSEEDSKNILREAVEQERRSSEAAEQERRATEEVGSEIEAVIEEEQRRALAERWQARSGTTVKSRRAAGRPLVIALVGLGVLGGVAVTGLYVEGPWTGFLDRTLNRKSVVATIDQTVDSVRQQLGL